MPTNDCTNSPVRPDSMLIEIDDANRLFSSPVKGADSSSYREAIKRIFMADPKRTECAIAWLLSNPIGESGAEQDLRNHCLFWMLDRGDFEQCIKLLQVNCPESDFEFAVARELELSGVGGGKAVAILVEALDGAKTPTSRERLSRVLKRAIPGASEATGNDELSVVCKQWYRTHGRVARVNYKYSYGAIGGRASGVDALPAEDRYLYRIDMPQ